MTEKVTSKPLIRLRVIPQGARDNRVPDKKGPTVHSTVTDLLFKPDEFFSLPGQLIFLGAGELQNTSQSALLKGP